MDIKCQNWNATVKYYDGSVSVQRTHTAAQLADSMLKGALIARTQTHTHTHANNVKMSERKRQQRLCDKSRTFLHSPTIEWWAWFSDLSRIVKLYDTIWYRHFFFWSTLLETMKWFLNDERLLFLEKCLFHSLKLNGKWYFDLYLRWHTTNCIWMTCVLAPV